MNYNIAKYFTFLFFGIPHISCISQYLRYRVVGFPCVALDTSERAEHISKSLCERVVLQYCDMFQHSNARAVVARLFQNVIKDSAPAQAVTLHWRYPNLAATTVCKPSL
jgi:hypothetical protein